MNIIVKGNNKPRGHQILTDGKDNSAEETRALKELELEYLKDQVVRLKNKKFKCELIEMVRRKPCIVGVHNREPFLVYMQKMMKGKEWCFLTTTRYRGESVDMIPPEQVLK